MIFQHAEKYNKQRGKLLQILLILTESKEENWEQELHHCWTLKMKSLLLMQLHQKVPVMEEDMKLHSSQTTE